MRLGIDLGGTKIEAVVLADDGSTVWTERTATERSDYDAIIGQIHGLVERAGAATGFDGPVGMGIPGSINHDTGRVQGASTQVLNDRDLKADCEKATGRPFRMENDANCFVLSEASDGAAAGHDMVFGVIIGTGCGGAFVHRGRVIRGGNNIAGEWGHAPLPWPRDGEYEGHECWCGLTGCLETFLAGPSVSREYERLGGGALKVQEIAARASGEALAEQVLQSLEDRLARALAQIIVLVDPDAIVLGGGVSNLDRLYTNVPPRIDAFVFSSTPVKTPVLKPKHGDSSGVRGAAWLWGDAAD